MNQILITKKLYITPELKRKKKIYKIDFILSILLVIALVGFYLYTEYDRTKGEEVAQDLVASVDDTTTAKQDALVVVLDGSSEDIAVPESEQQERSIVSDSSGNAYATVATVNIPKINVKYPVLLPEDDSTETIEKLLKISPCKFWGPDPNEVGNFCIVGHNYRSTKFFSKVPTLENGDILELTDTKGRTIQYKVYDKYTVDPTDVSCTTQLTKGKKEVTLITCTNDNQQRVIIKSREV